MMRLFVSIDLPAAARLALDTMVQSLRQHPGGRHVRWANLEQAHLTLKFLGDTPESTVPALERALEAVGGGGTLLTMTLTGVGAFPNCRRPRVIWAGLDAGGTASDLARLHAALEHDLVHLGFEADQRPFSPHITLGRVRQGLRPAEVAQVGGMLANPPPVPSVAFEASSLRLMESDLRPEGPIHCVVCEVPLGAR